jgi:gliding motility-associated-like protein
LNRLIFILSIIFYTVSLNAQQLRQQVICASSKARVYKIGGAAGMKFTWHVPKDGTVIGDTLRDSVLVVWQQSGTYTLSVEGTLNSCTSTKSISVKVNPTPIADLKGDTSFCQGHPLAPLEPAGINDDVLWFNGSTLHTYIPDTTEKVWVTVTNIYGCSASDTINVVMYPMPIITQSITDLHKYRICGIEKHEADAGNPGAKYYWTIQDTLSNFVTPYNTQKISVGSGPKTITVAITKNNCTVKDTIQIISCKLRNIPSGFTPNGDGHNDTWVIEGLYDNYPNATVEVYDRWGRLLYRSGRGYPEPWNGTTDKGTLPTDTYFYVIDYYGNGKSTQSGTVTIVR